MKSKLTYLPLLIVMLLTTSCNYREFCDLSVYEEHARIRYDWSQAEEETIPEDLKIQFENTRTSGETFDSKNDYYDLNLGAGDFNTFAWNPTENVTVKDRKFYADTNSDGSLKSVGYLYAGEKDFTLRPSGILEEEDEQGNSHEWNSPSYHKSDTVVKYKEIPILMLAQTRALRIRFKVNDESIDYIQSMQGVLEGICQSKGMDGNFLTSANINLTFTRDGEYMIATYRILGCTPDQEQNLTLNIGFTDGTVNPPLTVNMSDNLNDFNKDFGGNMVILNVDIDIKKTENSFSAVITDWENVTSGDNNDLEISE